MTRTAAGPALLMAARALLPRIRAAAGEIERERRLPVPLVQALADAGLFRMAMPPALGGAAVDPLTRFEVIEALATADAATAWCLEIGSGVAWMVGGWLREDVARAILCRQPYDLVCGAVAVARGRATPVPGGYRLTGRWPWGSGCTHSTWIAGAGVVDGAGVPPGADGGPVVRVFVVPASEVEIIDTWTSIGLRGSGSHDYAVRDVFVPQERTFSLLTDSPARPGPLYAFRGLYLAPAAGLALGVARAAIEALVQLAAVKVPNRATALLRERGMVQAQVAQAEALVGSARAFAYEVIADLWRTLLAGDAPSVRQRARYRLAITHAVQTAAQAVDLMYGAAGGSAVYAGSPLERQFRDIHTLAQHASLAPITLEPAGRMLLGLEPGAPFF
jgi:alkylation response protein AidB-like acyl-CoA dehydrogenase